jgi:hypothetical protein
MEPDRAIPGPAKSRADVPAISAEKAPVAEAVKENKAGVATARFGKTMPTDLDQPVHLTTRCSDDSLKASGKGVIDVPGYDGSGPDCAGPMTGGRRRTTGCFPPLKGRMKISCRSLGMQQLRIPTAS